MSDDEPQPIPRKSASGKKRSGPSMREQIAARRRAEAGGDGDAPAAAKPAAAKPAAAKPAAAKPAAKKAPAAKPAAAKKPAARPSARRAAASSDDDAPKAGGRSSRGSSRSSARRAGGGSGRSRRGDDDGDGEEGGARRGRRERPVKKKSPVPLIAAGVLVIGGGAGAYFSGMFNGGDAEASSGEETANDTDTASAGDTANDAADNGAANAGGDDASTPDDAATTGDDSSNDADGAATEDAPEEKPKKPKRRTLNDIPTEEIYADVRALPAFSKPDELDQEKWDKMIEDAALFFEDGGGPSARAKKRIIAEGKYAWPVLINELVKIDPAKENENLIGKLATDAMNAARGSDSRHGLDWLTPGNTKNEEWGERDIRHNLRIIKAVHNSWSKVVEDPSHWDKLDMTEQAEEAAEAAKKKAEESFDDEFGDLDDVDIDID